MGAIYFSHDEDARNDQKITRLRAKYGIEGYGCFFAILEMISSEAEHKLRYTDEQFEAIVYELRTKFEMREFVDKCIEIGLFSCDGEFFWSESFLRRERVAEEKSAKRSERAKIAAAKRWEQKGKTVAGKTNETIPNEEVVDDGWYRFVQKYEGCFGLIPHGGTKNGQMLDSYYKDFGSDVMCRAVDITVSKKPDSPIRFMLAILRNWAEQGVRTLNDVDAVAAERRDRKNEHAESEPAIRGGFY